MMKWGFGALLLLGIDWATKWIALASLSPLAPKSAGFPFEGIALFAWGPITASLNLVTNTGAAWGLFQGHATLLFFIRLLLLAAFILYALRAHSGMAQRLSLFLITVGAVGNALDYCLYRQVVDFLHFTFWGHSFPLFNFADTYITLGALGLLFLPKSVSKKAAAQ